MASAFVSQLDPQADPQRVEFVGTGSLPSAYAVTDLAAAAVAVAALAAQRLAEQLGTLPAQPVIIDRRLASLWFSQSLRPVGWDLPPVWDGVAGDYQAADGWIRLHTNAPHHRSAALGVLGCDESRDAVSSAVSRWQRHELEAAVVAAGGCAAAMRSAGEWAAHPQGTAVALEPVSHHQTGEAAPPHTASSDAARPLRGVRVLDLTRVLAGPVATRFLAGLGADVLRIDPLDWDEPAVLAEVALGKRCARLDLRGEPGAATVRALLAAADIVVHGYRPEALERLGLGASERQAIAPGLVDISLDAYGWTGPWMHRRGFDSLVQMSSGIADTGMSRTGSDKPVPLPVQALDHATGHLLAAAALNGWRERLTTDHGCIVRASLARMAAVLQAGPEGSFDDAIAPASPADDQPELEQTSWGPARRLRAPCLIPGVAFEWSLAAGALGRELPPLRWLDLA